MKMNMMSAVGSAGSGAGLAYTTFNRHNVIEAGRRLDSWRPGAVGSVEQEAIWKAFRDEQHMVIDSVAGSGKTFTSVEMLMRNGGGKAKTYHQLGFAIIREHAQQVRKNDYKTLDILDRIDKEMDRSVKAASAKMVSWCKNAGIAKADRDELWAMVDHYGLPYTDEAIEEAMDTVNIVLQRSAESLREIDFDDMLWLPVVKGLQTKNRYRTLLVDEYQDTNLCQQKLAEMVADRLVLVGDRRQAIYGFRGAATGAMDLALERLRGMQRGVREMRLTVCRRCPKIVLELARMIVPHIRPLDNAPEGMETELPPSKLLGMLRPGDLVLCRVNRPLISLAYELMKKRVPVLIKGRQLGQGILTLIGKMESNGAATLPELIGMLNEYLYQEIEKLLPLGERGEGRIAAIQERVECLIEMASAEQTLDGLKTTVETLFCGDADDAAGRVMLGTVHRNKGSEAPRVFVLNPEMMPWPTKRKWEMEQEENIGYVSVTRPIWGEQGDGELIWVGRRAPLFSAPVGQRAAVGRKKTK